MNMYKCEACGAPTRPNVDGDIRYDARKPLLMIERLRLALQKIADLPHGDCLKDPLVLGTHLNMARNYAASALKSE